MDFNSTAEEGSGSEDDVSRSPQVDPLLDLQRPIKGVQLYVCCHGSRDTRCGKLGHSLVTVLADLIRQHQLQDLMQVYKCSHVGGHKVCALRACLFIKMLFRSSGLHFRASSLEVLLKGKTRIEC